jgi:iron-sulfur cluster assembly protein
MMTITSAAAQEIVRVLKEKDKLDHAFRLKVVGGGCSGLSYDLSLDKPGEGDKVFEAEGAKLLVDMKSLLYVMGTKLDFQETLMERGFKFINPTAKKTCSCGTSFSA